MPEKNSILAGFRKAWKGGNTDYDSLAATIAAATDIDAYDADPVSTTALLGIGKRQQRQRQVIYSKYQLMLGDAVISAAMKLHTTGALGGHETSDELVFIEIKPEYANDAAKVKLVKEMAAQLQPIFNANAYCMGFNAAGYGDSYGRIYSNSREGVIDLVSDEMVMPPLVQPFERAGKTVGFVVSTGIGASGERLTALQMCRAKMQRTVYVPQTRAIDKAMKLAITEDDPKKLPVLPSLLGGSFLDGAEESYDNMTATLSGMVGQRILDSIDESLFTMNMESMTKEQRKNFSENIKGLFTKSKEYSEQALKEGRPRLGRIRHFLPVFNEKQIANISASLGSNRTATITVDDFMIHAKLLGGALGIDISMIGFADLLSGGLGDGGFYRVSMQAGERSRQLRGGLSGAFNHVCDVHLWTKEKIQVKPVDRFWQINFYGGQSAIKREEADIKGVAIQTASIVLAMLQQAKDMGAPEDAMLHLLEKEMMYDTEAAKMLVKFVTEAKPPAVEEQ